MPVYVTRKARGSAALRSAQVRALAERMLASLDRGDHELSVLLTDDPFIKTLNATHRGKDRPTDVLAFPLDETPADADSPVLPAEAMAERLLGDVVISLDTAERQAKARRHSLLDEVRFLLAHGILHLIGYDHETDAQEAEMNAMTAELVAAAATEPRSVERPPQTRGRRAPRK